MLKDLQDRQTRIDDIAKKAAVFLTVMMKNATHRLLGGDGTGSDLDERRGLDCVCSQLLIAFRDEGKG
jgi:hypothetical protein